MHFGPKHVAQSAPTSSIRAWAAVMLGVLLWPHNADAALLDSSVDFLGPLVSASDALRLHLARWLVQAADQGGFLPMLLGLALLNRLVVLPFAIKAERDQIVVRNFEPEVARLTDRLQDDPFRRARAIRQLYLRHGLTPLRNHVALLGFPILMLSGIAVGDAAAIGGYAIEPLGRLSRPDPTCLLAVMSAALVGFHADLKHARSWRHRLVIWLALVPPLTLALALLSAAIGAFVSLYALLLLLQRALVVGLPQDIATAMRKRLSAWRNRHGIVPLAQAGECADVGVEAARLGQMSEAGLPVPSGVVLTANFVARWQAAPDEEKRRLARKVTRAVGADPYSVRGWGTAQIGDGTSGAAPCIAVTNVRADDCVAAIDRVVASFETEHAALIVQRTAVAVQSGFLVTRAPDAAGLMLVEMIDGESDGFVSGRITPSSFRFGRRSGQRVGDLEAPFDLTPLVTFARGLEETFGAPQNIEWVWDGRKLWLLRSQDIGSECPLTPASLLNEWERVLALANAAGEGESVVRNTMCKALPRPTPATQSLIEALHASGGSVDLAYRALGFDYNVAEEAQPLFPAVFGRLYVNASEMARRVPKLSRLDRRRILGQAALLEKRIRADVLPPLAARLASSALSEFDLLTTGRLVREIGGIVERFVTESRVEAELTSIVAEVAGVEARDALRSGGHDPSVWLTRQGDASDASEALSTILEHRALFDYSLAVPPTPDVVGSSGAGTRSNGRALPLKRKDASDGLAGRTARLVSLARAADRLRKDVDHAVNRELDVLRKALLALDRRFDLRNGIFLLTLAEIVALSNADRERVRKLVAIRKVEREMIVSAGALPDAISLASVELASWSDGVRTHPRMFGMGLECFGVRVAGSRRTGGRACVVDEAAAMAGGPLSRLMPGDVLVAPFIHPAWFGEVLRASGVILSGGGWLCQMAIIARQRNIAVSVDVAGWADIPDGAYVTLELDGRIRVDAPRAPAGNERRALAEARS